MGYAAKIIADSMSPDGVRLTTMEVTFPRIVLAEFNTHRMLSRNSASSRAIPVKKMLARVMEDPFVPVWWGKNQKGMQAAEELSDVDDQKPEPLGGISLRFGSPRAQAKREWLHARDRAVESVQRLQEIDLHKQIANRLLEPWLWHTVIVTATEWDNFFALRCHKDAQPEIRTVAEMMSDLYRQPAKRPQELELDEWHMPYVADHEGTNRRSAEHLPRADRSLASVDYWKKVSVGRCAAVSYLNHEGVADPDGDVARTGKLATAGHMSPFEHVARPMGGPGICEDREINEAGRVVTFCGNFRGWVQMRKELPNEAVFQGGVT